MKETSLSLALSFFAFIMTVIWGNPFDQFAEDSLKLARSFAKKALTAIKKNWEHLLWVD